MEQNTFDIIQSLDISESQKTLLIEAIEWEKELSWSDGYATAVDQTDGTDWIDNLDNIDISDIEGKADPNADSFISADIYSATFKDPQTGETITVGDAYEREDDSPAYRKAYAYVAQFNPDNEAVMGTKAYDDLQKTK